MVCIGLLELTGLCPLLKFKVAGCRSRPARLQSFVAERRIHGVGLTAVIDPRQCCRALGLLFKLLPLI